MHLAECVPASDQSNRFFVVHRHATEGLANVAARSNRVRVGVRALRVHINETHLDGAEWLHQLAVAAIALVLKPDVLGTPVDLFGCPHVLAATSKPECLEAHRLHGDVACEDQEVGPADLAAVLLLNRLEELAGLVKVAVVGPAVERGEALLAGAATAATIVGAVGARSVPGHADEERAVVAIVRRPPVLAVGHQRGEIGFQRVVVERREFGCVVEIRVHWVAVRIVLVENVEVELVGPPLLVGRRPHIAMGERALCFRHWYLSVRVSAMDCEWRQAPVRSGLTGGAQAPVDDLGLVDEETMVVVCGEARGRADGAIDVIHQITPSANEMVMIVSNPVLVAGNRSCGLYPTQEVLLDEDPKCVVHGLTGDRSQLVANGLGDVLSGGVRVASQGFHHGDALSGDLEALISQFVGEVDGVRVVHEQDHSTDSGLGQELG